MDLKTQRDAICREIGWGQNFGMARQFVLCALVTEANFATAQEEIAASAKTIELLLRKEEAMFQQIASLSDRIQALEPKSKAA